MHLRRVVGRRRVLSPRAAGVAAALVSLTTAATTGAAVVVVLGADRSLPAAQRLGEQHPLVASLVALALVGPLALLLAAVVGRRGRWWFVVLAAVVAVADLALAARYSGPAPAWLLGLVAVQVLVLAVAAGTVAAA